MGTFVVRRFWQDFRLRRKNAYSDYRRRPRNRQLFSYELGSRKVVGTVGALQFEVIQYRLKHEYGATCTFSSMNLFKACWISSKDPKKLKEFMASKQRHIAKDKDGKLVFMAESKAWLQMVQNNFPEITFQFTSDLEE